MSVPRTAISGWLRLIDLCMPVETITSVACLNLFVIPLRPTSNKHQISPNISMDKISRCFIKFSQLVPYLKKYMENSGENTHVEVWV